MTIYYFCFVPNAFKLCGISISAFSVKRLFGMLICEPSDVYSKVRCQILLIAIGTYLRLFYIFLIWANLFLFWPKNPLKKPPLCRLLLLLTISQKEGILFTRMICLTRSRRDRINQFSIVSKITNQERSLIIWNVKPDNRKTFLQNFSHGAKHFCQEW